ncbi:MAG: phosphatidate cytidylyltransferase [Thiobacillus sp.]|nr:phosphatidate cytidylyltransferase [Thiobacillus sp.]
MPPNLQAALYGILALLVAGTVIIGLKKWLRPGAGDHELWLRMRSWWIMAGLFVLAIAVDRALSIVFFALVSFLALKEYFSIIPTRRADRRVLFWAYAAIPVQYFWVYDAWFGLFIIFIPVYLFLFIPLKMVIVGETQGFLKAAGTLHWGLMTTVFSLSHAAFLLALPDAKNPAAGSAGLLLFLVFLTQFNDVMQFVWGKLAGRRKVIPKVSPGKTVAGFVGGIATTTLVAWLAAPYLTPLTGWQPIAAGLIIGIGGFVGDVTISAIKRDLGIKDSGSLIPGHGGILDRVDSLTYTAPLFFHFVYYLHY